MEEGGPQGTTGAPTTRAREAELRTFLIADIRSYTSYTTEHGDEAAGALVARFAELTRAAVEANDGDLLELRGDEALAVFVSARRALRAAIDLQARVAEASLPRGVGIGIDAGEAVAVESGFRGTALNLAARLCAQAGPGEIIASETVVNLATRVEGIAYIDPRTYRLKGVDEPVRAVHVVPEASRLTTAQVSAANRSRNRVLVAAGVLALAAVLVGAVALSGVLGGGPSPTAVPSGPLTGLGSSPQASAAARIVPPSTAPTGTASATAGTSPPAGTTPPSSPVPSPSSQSGQIPTEDVPLLAFMDPATGAIADTQPPIGGQADAVFADGAFWMLGIDPLEFVRIDPDTYAVTKSIPMPVADSSWWTVADGTIWVTDRTKPRVVGIDTATGVVAHDYFLSDEPSDTTDADGVAVGAGSLWVAFSSAAEIDRVDSDTGKVQKRIVVRGPDTLAFGNGALWITGQGKLRRLDPVTNEVTATADLAANFDFLPYVTFSQDAAWTADETDGSVWKVDKTGTVRGTYRAGAGARPLQYMDGTVWVGNQDEGSVTGIDANTGAVTTYPVGHEVQALAAGNGTIMLGVNRSPADEVAALKGSVLTVAMTGDPIDTPDPAVNLGGYNRMIQFATCARLITYPDAPAPDGYVLQPEVASAMPTVSDDGLTYTFTLRPGFGFSPPSTEQITADTYRYSIERALSPKLGDGARGMGFLGDIEGAEAFNAGKADHVSGITAEGDALSITLAAPSPDFLQRLALPLACPVPVGTPIVPNGLDPFPPVPTSGPYYLALHYPGELAILKTNPNYGGTRTRGYDSIAMRFGLADGETAAWVDDGRAGMAIQDTNLQPGSDLAERWGPESGNAAAGDLRWYEIPYPGLEYLYLDPRGPLLSDPDVRSAISLALDRAAVGETIFELPADRTLSAAFQVRDPAVPELLTPDIERANELMAGRSGALRFAVFPDCPYCTAFANEVKSDLAQIGLTVKVVERDDPLGAASDPKDHVDIVDSYSQPLYPDAAVLLQQIVDQAPTGWLAKDFVREVQALGAVSGQERLDQAAAVAHEMVLDGSALPLAFSPDGTYFGPTVGCRTIVPGIMNVDLVALCPAGE